MNTIPSYNPTDDGQGKTTWIQRASSFPTVIAIMTCLGIGISMIPYSRSSVLGRYDQKFDFSDVSSDIAAVALLGSSGISLSKLVEYLSQHFMSNVMRFQTPYKIVYVIICIYSLVCFLVLYRDIHINISLSFKTTLSLMNICTIASSILLINVMKKTNNEAHDSSSIKTSSQRSFVIPHPYIKYIGYSLLLVTYITAEYLNIELFSVFPEYPKKNQYCISSMVLLAVSVIICMTLSIGEGLDYTEELSVLSDIIVNRSYHIYILCFIAIFMIAKLVCFIVFCQVFSSYDYWITSEIIQITIFSGVLLHLPHYLLCDEIINTKVSRYDRSIWMTTRIF